MPTARKRYTVNVPPDLSNQIEHDAQLAFRSIASQITFAVAEYYRSHPQETARRQNS